MSFIAIPLRDLPRLPRLVQDYVDEFGKVAEFFNGDFRDPAALAKLAERVASRELPRDALTAVLREQNQSFGCGPPTLEHIDLLGRPRTCAVVTGQQVGLFSGPLYTVYKALTAVKLAERLNRAGAGSFVPVFWLAADDHDTAEIDHIILLDQTGRIKEVRCPLPSGESRIPASKIAVPPDISECLRRLGELSRDSEFKADILKRLGDAYLPGRSLAEAFGRWMTRLFASTGLIFIDAGHPRLKALGSAVFDLEIAEDSAATAPALAASRRLRAAGYGEQIHLHEGILNIFYAERERRTIQARAGGFEIKDEGRVRPKEELRALVRKTPAVFSPNVLLRPIYQDAMLPTVAYVAGPGEIAYFAQMKGVYDRFGLPMPVIYPRKSVTLVEKSVDRILRKYGLKIPDVWMDPEVVVRAVAERGIPESLARHLDLAHSQVGHIFEPLIREIEAFDPTLKESARLAQGRTIQPLKFLEKKIQQAAKTQSDIAVRQVRKAADNLYPNRQLQERAFNIVPYLLKYGDAFLDMLDREIGIEDYDHQIITME